MRRELSEKLFAMHILIVDDEPGFREIFSSLLEIYGYQNVHCAANGEEAINLLKGGQHIDLVLSDVNMPHVDGIAVLEFIKSTPELNAIPVIMMSGIGQTQNVVKCIGQGAEDYLTKPLEKELLWARVQACLERKYLRDREVDLHRQVEEEKQKSETVLYNAIPRHIADRLRHGESNIAESVDSASVVFADLVAFTKLSHSLKASEVVSLLNGLFKKFDELVDEFGLEKIKTIGDCYMAAGGLKEDSAEHEKNAIAFSQAALEAVNAYNVTHQQKPLSIRIGAASGPLVAGIIGAKRPMYDVWGDTVNLASRMESHGLEGAIQITQAMYSTLAKDIQTSFEPRGEIEVKGAGLVQTYITK